MLASEGLTSSKGKVNVKSWNYSAQGTNLDVFKADGRNVALKELLDETLMLKKNRQVAFETRKGESVCTRDGTCQKVV